MTVPGSHALPNPPGIPRPREIQLALWLWKASAAAGLLRSILILSDRETLVATVRGRSPELSQTQVDMTVNGSVLGGLGFSIGLFLFYVVMARLMAKGHNWARVVLCVITAVVLPLGILGMLALASGVPVEAPVVPRYTPPVITTMIVDFACMAAATIQMFRPAANTYLRDRATAHPRRPPPYGRGPGV